MVSLVDGSCGLLLITIIRLAALLCDLGKALAAGIKPCLLARVGLPAPHDNVRVLGVDFDDTGTGLLNPNALMLAAI